MNQTNQQGTSVPAGQTILIKLELGQRCYRLDMTKAFEIDLLELEYDTKKSRYKLPVENQCLYTIAKSFAGANTRFNQMIAQQLNANKQDIDKIKSSTNEQQP